MTATDISKFVTYCENTLDLHQKLIVNKKTDPNETVYKSLPLCIIDAVFSIGIKYQSVINAEKNFIEYFKLDIATKDSELLGKGEYTISKFIKDIDSFGGCFAAVAKDAFHDRHRTSSKNGILKAEACYLVAKVFQKHKINTLEDFRKYKNKDSLDNEIKQVKGQSSGIMLKYLYMLAGKSDEIKPDRHMINYVKSVFPGIKGEKDYPEIIKIIKEAVRQLKGKYPMLTERFLDVLIWDYMRSQKVWVLSVQTSLPNICTSFQDLSSTVEVYESFDDAKLAFQERIKHYAFASNLIFNGDGKIKNLDTYLSEMISLRFDDYDKKVPEDLLTPQILSRIQNSLQLAFRGEETAFDFENTRYDDGIIGVDISEHKVKFFGMDELIGYAPVLHTNIFNMSEEKEYYLHVNPLFGYGVADGTAELYIDIRKAMVQAPVAERVLK